MYVPGKRSPAFALIPFVHCQGLEKIRFGIDGPMEFPWFYGSYPGSKRHRYKLSGCAPKGLSHNSLNGVLAAALGFPIFVLAKAELNYIDSTGIRRDYSRRIIDGCYVAQSTVVNGLQQRAVWCLTPFERSKYRSRK